MGPVLAPLPNGGVSLMEGSHDRLLRLTEVKSRTGLSRTTVYRRMNRGEFPQAISIGSNAVAWYESDIDHWVAAPMQWRAA